MEAQFKHLVQDVVTDCVQNLDKILHTTTTMTPYEGAKLTRRVIASINSLQNLAKEVSTVNPSEVYDEAIRGVYVRSVK